MGQVPAKYFAPPTPYGSSPNVGAIGAPVDVNATNNVQPTGVLPPINRDGGPQFQGGPPITPVENNILRRPPTGGGGTS